MVGHVLERALAAMSERLPPTTKCFLQGGTPLRLVLVLLVFSCPSSHCLHFLTDMHMRNERKALMTATSCSGVWCNRPWMQATKLEKPMFERQCVLDLDGVKKTLSALWAHTSMI